MKNYPQMLSLKYLEAASYIWNAKTERNFIIRIGMAINAFFNGRKISYIDAENFKIGRNKNTYAYNPISYFLNRVSLSTPRNYLGENTEPTPPPTESTVFPMPPVVRKLPEAVDPVMITPAPSYCEDSINLYRKASTNPPLPRTASVTPNRAEIRNKWIRVISSVIEREIRPNKDKKTAPLKQDTASNKKTETVSMTGTCSQEIRPPEPSGTAYTFRVVRTGSGNDSTDLNDDESVISVTNSDDNKRVAMPAESENTEDSLLHNASGMDRQTVSHRTMVSIEEEYQAFRSSVNRHVTAQTHKVREKLPKKGIAAAPIFISVEHLKDNDEKREILKDKSVGAWPCEYTDHNGKEKTGYVKKNRYIFQTVYQYVSDRIQAHLFFKNPMLGTLRLKAVNSKLLLNEKRQVVGSLMSDIREKEKLNAPELESTGALIDDDFMLHCAYMSGNHLALKERDPIEWYNEYKNIIGVNQKKLARIDNEYVPSSLYRADQLYECGGGAWTAPATSPYMRAVKEICPEETPGHLNSSNSYSKREGERTYSAPIAFNSLCLKNPENAFTELKKHLLPLALIKFFLCVQGIADVVNECGSEEFKQAMDNMLAKIMSTVNFENGPSGETISQRNLKVYILGFSNVENLREAHKGVFVLHNWMVNNRDQLKEYCCKQDQELFRKGYATYEVMIDGLRPVAG